MLQAQHCHSVHAEGLRYPLPPVMMECAGTGRSHIPSGIARA